MKTKIIAFYLPQFYENEENNKWWGKGFTEWTNVKKANPLYKDHYQPKVPYQDNYYCLLDVKTLEWQAEIARQNGIYGFCYYHYWFDGKLLLEKPAEIMLKNRNVKISFCMSWANEPWTRTWTGENTDVLMPQKYGTSVEWEKHLQYLLPFFLDERYILRENKPLFLIYRAENIPECAKMLQYWNDRLKEYGFAGIYVLETLTGWQREKKIENSDGVVAMEPMHCMAGVDDSALRHLMYIRHKLGFLNLYSYNYLWRKILKKDFSGDGNSYYGGFVDWDNTARKGNAARIVKGFSLERFKKYLQKMYTKCEKENKEYLFFNAWNEWGEGAYLEPDAKYGYCCLNIIKGIVQDDEQHL